MVSGRLVAAVPYPHFHMCFNKAEACLVNTFRNCSSLFSTSRGTLPARVLIWHLRHCLSPVATKSGFAPPEALCEMPFLHGSLRALSVNIAVGAVYTHSVHQYLRNAKNIEDIGEEGHLGLWGSRGVSGDMSVLWAIEQLGSCCVYCLVAPTWILAPSGHLLLSVAA